MFNKIALREFAQEDLTAKNWQRLNALALEVVSAETETRWRAELVNSDVTMVKLGHIVNRADIESAPQLKYVGVFASDVSPIDLAAATTRGITVCNVAGYSTEAVAEFALGVTLDHFRELPRARRQAEAKNYSAAGFKGREVQGKTCGVIGLGRIGARVAELMLALGAEVLYWSRSRKPDPEARGISYSELEPLLAASDILSLNLALTHHTHGLLNRARVQQIKRGALFLVLSPVDLFDYEAVYQRVRAGDLTMAVNYSHELNEQQVQQLELCEHCYLYPPISYQTAESKQMRQDLLVANLEHYRDGHPTNKVN